VATSSALRELLAAPARQAATLEETAHRPWPRPERSWVQAQTWDDLLFAHWRVAEQQLRTLVPPPLEVETFDGSGWLGITPFRVTGLRLRGLPAVPVLSSFLELNVRTYVTYGGKPGIWFFSLDASSPLVVEGARRTYFLPYHRARMSAGRRGEWIEYACSRVASEGRPYVFEGRYRPVGDPAPPRPGSLEHFLVERYCLYALDDDEQLLRAEIHHPPWPLQEADAVIELNTMAPRGSELADEPALLHFSARQDVVIWTLERVSE
jgi:uncharacterized protein YqjF (DUF2071 family)